MKYILLMYHEEGSFSDEEMPAAMEMAVQACHDLHGKGQYLAASPLQSVETATSVRVKDGKRTVVDGPFAETKEQLGGYVLIEAENLEQAIEAASQFPAALKGTVEIRPLEDIPS